MYALLRNKPQPTMEDITQALAGLFYPVDLYGVIYVKQYKLTQSVLIVSLLFR